MLRHRDVPGLELVGGYWWHPQTRQPLGHFWAEFTQDGVLFEAGDQRFYDTASWQANTYAIKAKPYTRHTPAQLVEVLGAATWEEATSKQRAGLRRMLISGLMPHATEYARSLGYQVRCDLCRLMPMPPEEERVAGRLYCRCLVSARVQSAIKAQLRALERLEREQGTG